MSALDDFQIAMLTALETGGEVADIVAQVDASAPDAATRAWVRQWDPALVELAVELVQTWSVRDVAGPRGRRSRVAE